MRKITAVMLVLVISIPVFAIDTNLDFGIQLNPYIHFSKLTMSLVAKLNIVLENGNIQWDRMFSDYLPPERIPDETDTEYALRTTSHYLQFIHLLQWGNESDPFYLRFGKLSGATMGDGALIDAYYDDTVAVRESNFGLIAKFDGKSINFPYFGIEFMTNNLFTPSFVGFRSFSRPLAKLDVPVIKDIEIGISYAKPLLPKGVNMDFTALDFSIPLCNADLFTMQFANDFMLQIQQNSAVSFAYRFGLNGVAFRHLRYSMTSTIPVAGTFNQGFISSGFEKHEIDKLVNSGLDAGQGFYFKGSAALFSTSYEYQLGGSAFTHYNNKKFDNYGAIVYIRIERTLKFIKDMIFSYTKSYPENEAGVREPFFQGLATLDNTRMSLNTTFSFFPLAFDLDLTFEDKFGERDFNVTTLFRLSF